MRKELVGTRIRVMTVDPGQVLTVCIALSALSDVTNKVERSSMISDMGLIGRRLIKFMRK